MRILVLSNLYPPDFLGGYELACRQAVDALRESGHDVLVLTGNPRVPVTEDAPWVRRDLRLTDIYDPTTAGSSHPVLNRMREFEAYGVSAFNVLSLARVVEEFEPDVAYVHNVAALGGLGLLTALQQLEVPWVMHLGDCIPKILCGLGRRVHPEAGAAFVRAIRGRFICVSQTLLHEIADAGIDLSARSRFLPYWIMTEGSPQRERFFRPGEPLRIVNSGALGTHKGTDILIQAVGLLRQRGFSNVTVDLYGPGSEHDFRALALRLGVQDQVRFCGSRPQQELYDLYPTYDLFAFPTHAREPFGMAPMEAAAHGCVPVVSDRCGYSEWFVQGLHCLKTPRSAEGFAAAFERVLTGEVDLPALARRSMAVTLRDFHVRSVLPAIEDELRRAARVPPVRPRPPVDEVYRLAILAEKSLALLIQEADTQPAPTPLPAPVPVPEEVPVDFNFFNHTSAGAVRMPLTVAQRVLRRVLRPMFHRLRDVLVWLYHRTQENQRAIATLEARLAETEAALQKRDAEAKALELDHLALVRRLATLEERALAQSQSGNCLNGLYKLDSSRPSSDSDRRKAS